MILTLLSLILLTNSITLWKLFYKSKVKVISLPMMVEDVLQAIKNACAHQGLNMDAFGPDFDLIRTGHLQDILIYAANELKVNHRLQTVQDVVTHLQKEL